MHVPPFKQGDESQGRNISVVIGMDGLLDVTGKAGLEGVTTDVDNRLVVAAPSVFGVVVVTVDTVLGRSVDILTVVTFVEIDVKSPPAVVYNVGIAFSLVNVELKRGDEGSKELVVSGAVVEVKVV